MTAAAPPRKQRLAIPPADRERIVDGLLEIMSTGQFAYGEWVVRFEALVAEMAGTRHAVATGSGTQAVEIMIRALRLRGKRIAIAANGYVATAQAVIHAGAFVHFTDVFETDLMLDPAKLPKAPGAIDAVLVTHIGGNVSENLPAILDYCKERDIPLLEDAAHAHGSIFTPLGRAGGLGKAAAFSFFPTKLVHCGGEGGVVTTDSDEVAEFARRFRHHGRTSPGHEEHTPIVMHEHNFCMDEMRMLVGWHNMQRLWQSVRARRVAARVYQDYFSLVAAPGSNFYKAITLDPVVADFPLPGKVYLVPIPREPCWGQPAGMYPVAERVCQKHACLPMYNDIAAEEAQAIAERILESTKRAGGILRSSA